MAPAPRSKVLFLCTGNSARSQMAEALLRALAPDRFDAVSAGTEPKGVHPLTVKVMTELGADMSRARSKHIREFEKASVDLVISVCDRARNACPVWPGGARRLAWSFDDPAAVEGPEEARLAAFRRIRDEIAVKVREFVKDAKPSLT